MNWKTLAVLAALACRPAVAADVRAVAERIRTEAARGNDSPEGRPLPLATHWCTGSHSLSEGFAPVHQIQWIERGRHILPWFHHPRRDAELSEEGRERFRAYFEKAIRRAAEMKLPLCFKASQWEKFLSAKPTVELPPEQNPNVVGADGKIQKMVSPFGPVGPWRELGRTYTDNPQMKRLQAWYPDPPLVVFLSNNEHRKLRWHQAETSKRYLAKHGEGKDADFKRKVVADGWIERFRALQQGMRDGLASPRWRQRAIFVGYGAFGPEHLGRWGGWPRYALHSKGRITPYPLMWDGGSPSYYTHDWNPSTDHTVWSPQVEFQNLVFVQREALKLNPRFWVEMSVWDGYSPSKPGKKPRNVPTPTLYRLKGQTYDPTRYRGFVQFGMWLLRPRAVREFRGWTFPSEEGLPYFGALCDAVDRVHNSATLREWWRKGTLVPNRAHVHHYQAAIPDEWRQVDRWFLLDTSLDPPHPWELFWELRVFALALVRGEKPGRQWLVYAHAPVKARKGVKLTIPEYREITVDVSVGGSFYLLDEKAGSISPVK